MSRYYQQPEVKVPYGSVEYLYVDVKADVTLDTQAVEIGFSADLPPATWETATWQGTADTFRTCRVLMDGTLAVGNYTIWVRVTDTPEVPIIEAGKLKIYT